jgi:hypothetical protein
VALQEHIERSSGAGPAVDFDAAWPRARHGAAAALAARGVQPADADDLLQDVAIRALRQTDRFESDEHFGRWCRRVALNLHVDGVRRRRRLSPLPPPDAPSSEDTAIAVERRIALRRLAAGVAELSVEERRLLFEPARAASRQEAVRLAVRRHRLRARLAALVDGMAAGVAFVRRLPRTFRSPVNAGLVAAPVVFVALLLGPLATTPGEEIPHTPQGPHASDVLPVAASQATPPGSSPTGSRVPSPGPAPRRAYPVTTSPPTGSSVRTIIRVDAAGQPFAVRQWPNNDALRVCTGGLADACVSHPRPQIPSPTLPSFSRMLG